MAGVLHGGGATTARARQLPADTRRRAGPEAIIEEARRRGRRRRAASAVAVAAVLGGGGAAAAIAGGNGQVRTNTPNTVSLPRGGPTVDPRAFEHQGLLAFASNGGLYLLDGASGALRQVGHLRSGAESPSFSHDGRWLAYIAAGKETSVYGGGEEAPYAPAPGPLVIASSDGASAHVVGKVGQVEEVAWSPSTDELMVVSSAGYTLDGSAVWLVSPDGKARRLVSEANIYGAVWSPDGQQVAVALGGNAPANSPSLLVFPAKGGRPTVWARTNGAKLQWLVPLGWWERQGIAAWAGGNGTAPSGEGTLSGAELVLVRRPRGRLLNLGRTPAIGLVPVAGSSTGWLAFDDLRADSWGRTPWSKGQIETCTPTTDRCHALPEAAGATAVDPAWKPDGHALAYVQAEASSVPSSYPGAVRAWYGSGRLYVLQAGSRKPAEVAGSQGATAPQWSPKGTGALVYVARDSLFLVRKVGAPPIRIAGPLLPSQQWASTYYGQVDWRYMFAWGP
jgi:WD40 repeat protein